MAAPVPIDPMTAVAIFEGASQLPKALGSALFGWWQGKEKEKSEKAQRSWEAEQAQKQRDWEAQMLENRQGFESEQDRLNREFQERLQQQKIEAELEPWRTKQAQYRSLGNALGFLLYPGPVYGKQTRATAAGLGNEPRPQNPALEALTSGAISQPGAQQGLTPAVQALTRTRRAGFY